MIFTDYKKFQAITVSKDCKPSSNYESMCNPVNKAGISLGWKKKEALDIISNYLVTEMEFSVPAKMILFSVMQQVLEFQRPPVTHIW